MTKLSFFSASKIEYGTSGELFRAFIDSDYHRAKKILRANPLSLVEPIYMTDSSGRIFDKTSPMTYCIWACDFNMWQLILDHLPEDPGKKNILLKSMQSHLAREASYVDEEGGEYEEKHCSAITRLIVALKECQELMIRIETAPEEERESLEEQANELWVKKVGTAQRGLPVSLIRLYNDFRIEFNNPDFKWVDARHPADTHTTFSLYSDSRRERYEWYNLKIGEIYAIDRGYGNANFSSLTTTCASVRALEYQMNFLTAYLSHRKEQYKAFSKTVDQAQKQCQAELRGSTSTLKSLFL